MHSENHTYGSRTFMPKTQRAFRGLRHLWLRAVTLWAIRRMPEHRYRTSGDFGKTAENVCFTDLIPALINRTSFVIETS